MTPGFNFCVTTAFDLTLSFCLYWVVLDDICIPLRFNTWPRNEHPKNMRVDLPVDWTQISGEREGRITIPVLAQDF